MSLFLAACHGNEQRIYRAPALHCKTIKYRLSIDEDDHKGWGKPHVGKGEWSENRYFCQTTFMEDLWEGVNMLSCPEEKEMMSTPFPDQ